MLELGKNNASYCICHLDFCILKRFHHTLVFIKCLNVSLSLLSFQSFFIHVPLKLLEKLANCQTPSIDHSLLLVYHSSLCIQHQLCFHPHYQHPTLTYRTVILCSIRGLSFTHGTKCKFQFFTHPYLLPFSNYEVGNIELNPHPSMRVFLAPLSVRYGELRRQ